EDDHRQVAEATDLLRACGGHAVPSPLPDQQVAAGEVRERDRLLRAEHERVVVEELRERVELRQDRPIAAAPAGGLVAAREHLLAERAEPGAAAVQQDRDLHATASSGTDADRAPRERHTCASDAPITASTTSDCSIVATQWTKSRSTL